MLLTSMNISYTFAPMKNLIGSKQAFQMTNVDGLILENVTITGSTGLDTLVNCINFQFTNCDFTDSAITRVEFDSVPNASLTGTMFDN